MVFFNQVTIFKRLSARFRSACSLLNDYFTKNIKCVKEIRLICKLAELIKGFLGISDGFFALIC